MPLNIYAQPDLLADARKARKKFAEINAQSGQQDATILVHLIPQLEKLASTTDDLTKARALYELSAIRHLLSPLHPLERFLRNSPMHSNLIPVATQFEIAAKLADRVGAQDLACDAWMGVAYARSDLSAHGAAIRAYEHALDAVGATPTSMQRDRLAVLRAHLEFQRGELEASLVDALDAIRSAPDDQHRFGDLLAIAQVLQKLAFRSFHHPLVDERSADDGSNIYGACYRAIAASRAIFSQAAHTADSLGWDATAANARQAHPNLDALRQVFEMRAGLEASAPNPSPRDLLDVEVTRDFSPPLPPFDNKIRDGLLASLNNDSTSDVERAAFASISGEDPTPFLLGITNTAERQRRSFFDPRQRGTTIEPYIDQWLQLALRLLAQKRWPQAFRAFESMRSRGLNEVVHILGRTDLTKSDRTWFADQVRLEAEGSRLEALIVERVISTADVDVGAADFEALEGVRSRRRSLLRANDHAAARLNPKAQTWDEIEAHWPIATLEELREAATKADVAVISYWSTLVDGVIVWVVGPKGCDVLKVFLPQHVLLSKINSVVRSVNSPDVTFDVITAKELFLLLIGPLVTQLEVAQIMIVPHGPSLIPSFR